MDTARVLRLGGMLVGGIIATFILAAFIVPPFLDWNKYRGQVESAASSLLDQQVKIDGDLKVSILPIPTVNVTSVRLLGTTEEISIATVGSLDVALSAMSLLSGNVNISRLTLDDAKLSLLQSSSGDWTVEGLVTRPSEGETQSFDLDDFRVVNSEISLIQSDGTATTVSNLMLNVAGTVPAGPIEWSGEASVHDVPITLSGRLKSLSNIVDKSIKLELAFAGSTVELSGKLPESGGFEGRFKATSENAARFEGALYKLVQLQLNAKMPSEPLELDARLDFSNSKGSLETKRFLLGEITARAAITFLGSGFQQFSGQVAVGTIDLDKLQFPEQEKIVYSNVNNPNKNKDLFGDIEVTVEAIKWHGETIRQIDIALALDDDKIDISKVQALIPGGGTLSLGGKYYYNGAVPSFAGRVGMETGKLSDLLIWFGADASSLPADRLMSLSWRSSMALRDNIFSITGIKAHLDDSDIKGSVSFAEDYSLDSVDLTVDKLNLDAYLTATSLENADAADSEVILPRIMTMAFGDMIYQGTHFTSLSVAGKKQTNGSVALTANTNAFGGVLGLKGTVSSLSPSASRQLTLTGKGIDKLQLVAALMTSNDYTRALGGKLLDMQLAIDGTLDNLSLDANFSSGGSMLRGKGSVSIVDNVLTEMDMQGRVEIADSGKLLQLAGIDGAKGPIYFDVTMDGNVSEALDLRIAGDVAGSELITKGVWSGKGDAQKFKGDINLAVGGRASLPSSLAYMPALAGLRFKSDIDYSPAGFAMNKIEVALAGGRITGDITLSGADYKEISGAITADGLVIEDAPSKPATLAQPWSRQNFRPLPTQGMTGSLAMVINSLTWKGQGVANGNGIISFNNNELEFKFNKLLLNNKPAILTASITDIEAMRHIDVTVDAQDIRLAPLLQSLTGKVVTEGEANLKFSADGFGKSAYALVSSLEGQGEIHATAGTFKFMDLVRLASALRNPASGVGAIQSMGGMLGKGNTSYSQLDGTMTMNKGILSINSLNGAGDWGTLDITGPVNLVSETMDLRGAIVLSRPQDVPEIGVSFTGPITQPKQKFDTGTLLKYALTKVNILRRDEVQQAADKAGEQPRSSTEAIVSKAFDFLNKLKKKKKDEDKDIDN